MHLKLIFFSFFHAFQTYGRKIVYTCICIHIFDQLPSTMAALPVSHGRLLPSRWIKLFGSNDRMVSYYYRTVIQVLRQSASDMRMFYKTVSVFPLENLRKHFENRTPGLRYRLFNGWYSVCIRFIESETSQRSKPPGQSAHDPLSVFSFLFLLIPSFPKHTVDVW